MAFNEFSIVGKAWANFPTLVIMWTVGGSKRVF